MVPLNPAAVIIDSLAASDDPFDQELARDLRHAPIAGGDPPEWMAEDEFVLQVMRERRMLPSIEQLKTDPTVAIVLEAGGPGGRLFDIPR